MLTNNLGQKMTAEETSLFAKKDDVALLELLEQASKAKKEITEAFVLAVMKLNHPTLTSFILTNENFISEKVLAALIEQNNIDWWNAYWNAFQGKGLTAQHIIRLIEIGNFAMIDMFFKRYALLLFEYNGDALVEEILRKHGDYPSEVLDNYRYFSEVVSYLYLHDLYDQYSRDYMPRRRFTHKKNPQLKPN